MNEQTHYEGGTYIHTNKRTYRGGRIYERTNLQGGCTYERMILKGDVYTNLGTDRKTENSVAI